MNIFHIIYQSYLFCMITFFQVGLYQEMNLRILVIESQWEGSNTYELGQAVPKCPYRCAIFVYISVNLVHALIVFCIFSSFCVFYYRYVYVEIYMENPAKRWSK